MTAESSEPTGPSGPPGADGDVALVDGDPIFELLTGFISELRDAGLPVSLTESIDAMRAVEQIPVDDRETFKYALAGTLVKNHAHWRTFETVFEVYFSLRGSAWQIDDESAHELDEMLDEMMGAPGDGEGDGQGQGGSGEPLSAEQLAEMLYRALMRGDDSLLRAIARQSVKRFAGMEPGRPVGGTYYLYRTLRNLDLDAVMDRLMESTMADGTDRTRLEERLTRDEFEHRIDQLKKEIEAEIRRRLVADRGIDAMSKTLRKPLPEDVDFMHASREEMDSIKKALQPLARRLAVRLARKRRHNRKGPLDFRATVRHSLSYGGVPAEPRFKYPRPHKPEIFVIADISGSVASFARFTLMLVHAIASQFSKVRSFVFIDGIDEVTSFFDGVEDVSEAVHRVNTEADVVWVDGHSDYGHAFEEFHNRWGAQISPKTTVILLGDARNNYHASESWVVKEMRHRARHVYWLNPEPRNYWDTGDSIVSQYGVYCDGVFECRNLRQLERFVETLD